MFAVDTKKPKPQPAGTQQGPVQELETARAVFQNLRDEDRKITAQIQALEGHLNGRAHNPRARLKTPPNWPPCWLPQRTATAGPGAVARQHFQKTPRNSERA